MISIDGEFLRTAARMQVGKQAAFMALYSIGQRSQWTFNHLKPSVIIWLLRIFSAYTYSSAFNHCMALNGLLCADVPYTLT